MINVSAILCGIAGVIGLYVAIRNQRATKWDSGKELCGILPVIIGTLAWVTAAAVFVLAPSELDSKIELQRLMMVVSWSWLAFTRIKI